MRIQNVRPTIEPGRRCSCSLRVHMYRDITHSRVGLRGHGMQGPEAGAGGVEGGMGVGEGGRGGQASEGAGKMAVVGWGERGVRQACDGADMQRNPTRAVRHPLPPPHAHAHATPTPTSTPTTPACHHRRHSTPQGAAAHAAPVAAAPQRCRRRTAPPRRANDGGQRPFLRRRRHGRRRP